MTRKLIASNTGKPIEATSMTTVRAHGFSLVVVGDSSVVFAAEAAIVVPSLPCTVVVLSSRADVVTAYIIHRESHANHYSYASTND